MNYFNKVFIVFQTEMSRMEYFFVFNYEDIYILIIQKVHAPNNIISMGKYAYIHNLILKHSRLNIYF